MSTTILPREEWCLVERAERETVLGGIVVPNEAIGGDVYRILAVGPGTRENMAWWKEHAPRVGARVFVIGHGGVIECRVGGKMYYLVRGDCVTAEIVEEQDDMILRVASREACA